MVAQPGGTLGVGDTIRGYSLIEEVGRGGMGAVFKAKAPGGSIVAVKVLAPHLINNHVQLSRFYREAEIAMKLRHPNVVAAMDLGEENGQHFIVMEFVDGDNLGKLLARVGRFSEQDAVRILVGIARGLHQAHRLGIVHRDIKPDNILMTAEGEPKITDLGLVKVAEDDLNLTKTGRGLGTPHFMAPEQFRDAKKADARSDVYSLGATLYMLITGEVPFRGSTAIDAFFRKMRNEYVPPEDLRPELSPRIVQAIKRAMLAEQAKRPGSAKELIELLTGRVEVDPATKEPETSDGRSDPSMSTLPDVPPPPAEDPTAVPQEGDPKDPIWYLVSTDASGQQKKWRGKFSAIEAQIKAGRIGPLVLAGKQKTGSFVPVSKVAEFAHLFPAKEGSTGKASQRPMASPLQPNPAGQGAGGGSSSDGPTKPRKSQGPSPSPLRKSGVGRPRGSKSVPPQAAPPRPPETTGDKASGDTIPQTQWKPNPLLANAKRNSAGSPLSWNWKAWNWKAWNPARLAGWSRRAKILGAIGLLAGLVIVLLLVRFFGSS